MSYTSASTVINKAQNIMNDGECNAPDIVFCANTITNSGRLNASNRITLVGKYLQEKNGSLNARKVEIFSSMQDLIAKGIQYAQGTVAGKSMDDSIELLNHALKLDTELVLSELTKQGGLVSLDNLLRTLLAFVPANTTIKKALSSIFKIIAAQYSKNLVPGKNQDDVGELLKRASDLDPQDDLMVGNPNINDSKRLMRKAIGNDFESMGFTFNFDSDSLKKSAPATVESVFQILNGDVPGKGINDARSILEELLKKDPENIEIKRILVMTLQKIAAEPSLITRDADGYPMPNGYLSQLKVCVELLKRASSIDPDNISIKKAWALALNEVAAEYIKDSPWAHQPLDLYKQAIAIDPNPVIKQNLVIFLYRKAEQFRISDDLGILNVFLIYEEILGIDSNHLETLTKLATLKAKVQNNENDYPMSSEVLNRILSKNQ